MHLQYKTFLEKAESKAFDLKHRATLKYNISKYDQAVERCKLRYSNFELAKQRVAFFKTDAINNLDNLLLTFEKNITKRGAEVLWATTHHEAINLIKNIIQETHPKLVVKSKSMVTEEIELNQFLESQNIEVLETDLGEFIVQVAGEKPYHLLTPAMHKSKADVSQLFEEKFKTPTNSSPEFVADWVRTFLREKFIAADIGITGANFLVADTGAISITENEGNGVLSMSMPKIHIAIVGIEKIIPTFNDLSKTLPLLAAQGTGQQISAYNTIIFGPRQEGENFGPEKLYIILLDNGRTEVLEDDELWQSLTCVRCGACLNVCPVYKNIGGHSYNAVYSGPIGSVISQVFNGMDKFYHLSYACSLCGKCTEICTSKIPLHKMLLEIRRQAVAKGFTPFIEKQMMKNLKRALLRRSLFDIGFSGLRNFIANKFGSKAWGKNRTFPTIEKSFSKQFIENSKNINKI